MFSALFTFLGGAAFRYLVQRGMDWLEDRQDHLQEIDRIKLQEQIDQGKHVRQKELIELQASLKVQEVKLVGEQQIGLEEAKAFTEAMKVANQSTGNKIIDAWNGGIRPAAASVAIAIWLLKLVSQGMALVQWDQELVSAILGYYFADRSLGKNKQ